MANRIDWIGVLAEVLEEQMSKSHQTTFSEKRHSRRVKLAQTLRVRPSAPAGHDFTELVTSRNATRHGVYFHTHRTDYRKGMRLFVTFPFTFENDPVKTDYLAEVVRVDRLSEYRFGIAILLISTI